MDNADFLGTYVLRDKERLDVMPARNVSGMWQAWLLHSGGILVRALSEDLRPFGDTFPMSRDSFFSLLLPLAPEAVAAPEKSGQTTGQTTGKATGKATGQTTGQEFGQEASARADSSSGLPDLLDMWYTQAAGPASETGPASSGPASGPALSSREKAQRMSAAFAVLMGKMQDQAEADPEWDKAVEKLLADAPLPAREHKFMFTDFGRALRRKGRHRLSLRAHLLALACAPDDEHVLFNVARSQYEAGLSLEAVASLEKAVKAAPDFREAAHFLQFLRGSSKKDRGRL